jgi:hypothetical protein
VIHLNLTRSQISCAKIYDGHWSQIRGDHCQKNVKILKFLVWIFNFFFISSILLFSWELHPYQLPNICMNSLTQLVTKFFVHWREEQRANRDFTWKRESDYRSVTIRENVIIIKTDGASQERVMLMFENWIETQFLSTEIVHQDSSSSNALSLTFIFYIYFLYAAYTQFIQRGA